MHAVRLCATPGVLDPDPQASPRLHGAAQICGDASVTVFREAASAGVARAAFVSVHDYKFPGARGASVILGMCYVRACGVACDERGGMVRASDTYDEVMTWWASQWHTVWNFLVVACC